MQCVICKNSEVKPATVEAELKVDRDRLLVQVQAEKCMECSEAYYSTETLRYLERVRENFARRVITPPLIGNVYQVSELDS